MTDSGRGFLSGNLALRRLVLPLAALVGLLASGSASLAHEQAAPDLPEPDSPEASEPEESQPEEALDVDLQFALDNGFESFFFAQSCRSIGPDGDVIEGEELPVGNERELECETLPVDHLQAIDLSSSTGERFCALGQLASVTGENIDPRLTVDVVSTPDGGPWVLSGTSTEAITIRRVTGFGGGTAFPLAADALFDVIEIRPNPTGDFCSVVLGL